MREIIEQGEHARRHVEAHRIAGAPRRAGIIRHQDRDPPRAAREAAQANKSGDAVRHHGDAVGFGAACERGEGERGVRAKRILKRDRAGEHAAVKLGQHDMHGKIGGPEPARAVAPGGAFRGCTNHLKNRDLRAVERGGLPGIAAGRERGHGHDERRIELRQSLAQKAGRRAVL